MYFLPLAASSILPNSMNILTASSSGTLPLTSNIKHFLTSIKLKFYLIQPVNIYIFIMNGH